MDWATAFTVVGILWGSLGFVVAIFYLFRDKNGGKK
jgi:uncharacterized membrane protein